MTLARAARRELAAYGPADGEQRRLRRDFLAVLDAGDGAVWRSHTPAHLTASAIILDADRKRIVLALHGKVRRWLQVGGHCEEGDRSLAAAALREATEESGITGLTLVPGLCDLDRHPAPCNPGVVEEHLDVRFAILAPPDAQTALSAESLDVQWFPRDQLPAGAEEDLGRAVRAAVRHAASGAR